MSPRSFRRARHAAVETVWTGATNGETMGYEHIEVSPITSALGAEVSGVNLARPLDDHVMAEVHRALLDHLVLFFRGQDLTPEHQLSFARRFGELEPHDFVSPMPGYPDMIQVVREADEEGPKFGGRWHTDVTFKERPALGSVLYAVEVPPYGGDTLFANQYLAYETLSPGMQRLLEGMTALHTAAATFGPQGRARSAYRGMNVNTDELALQETEHPVVRTHPETGRKCLFVNGSFTHRFKDMSEEDSRPLLDRLVRHATEPALTCRFRWTSGTLAIWDNRCTQHYALNDHPGHRREMRRVTIAGERPA